MFISLFIFLLLCCLLLTDIAMVLWITMAIEASYVHRHVLLRLPRHLRLQIRWPRAVSFTSQGPHGRVSLLWSLQWYMSMLLQAPTAPSQSWSPVIGTSATRRRCRQGGTRDQLAPSSTTNLSMKLSAYTVFPPQKTTIDLPQNLTSVYLCNTQEFYFRMQFAQPSQFKVLCSQHP